MQNLFLQYPKCSTCRKAKKWLQDNNIDFLDRDITLHNPTKEEIKNLYEKSGLELKKFFNTSGVLYKEMGLKDKIKNMTEDEMIDILATDGKLIKRPIFANDNIVLIGFKEEEYNKLK